MTRSARATSRWLSVGLLGVGSLVLGSAGIASAASPPAASPPAASPHVVIADFAFTPATITIGQHDVVTWRNDGPSAHTVTAADGSFDSGTLAPGDAFGNQFDEAGTFAYHCAIHPRMTGMVIVEPVAATPEASGSTPPPGTPPPGFSPLLPAIVPSTEPAASNEALSPTPAPPSSGSVDSTTLAAGAAVLVILVLAGLVLITRRRRSGR